MSSRDERRLRSARAETPQPNSDACCTVRISGGLGNQLFQYAAGRSVSIRTGARLILETSFFTPSRHRSLELNQFPVSGSFEKHPAPSTLVRTLRKLIGSAAGRDETWRETAFHYEDSFERVSVPVILEGYFQSWRYFAGCQNVIRTELSVPTPRNLETRDLGMRMRDQQAVALHVRRGDYVSNPKARSIYAECPMDYYRRAMDMMPSKSPVVVFSDDPEWARSNLPGVRSLIFPNSNSENSALSDLWLMSQAWHHIIANSTFSWWGAWLAGEEKGLTVAPRKWFNDPAVRDSDLFPPTWQRI
ncbi:MAG: alpha-1,2-fucosyltransferase [Planctomyces sp.]|nr:alpha-1,2-fucosyltransferase [Planctomyces sp.]